MVTKKIYYSDINKSEFEAEVIEAVKEKKSWKVILDRTCFFPEGGGQPADKGWINGIAVIDVQKQENENIIYHYLTGDPGKGPVKGKIDMERRRDFMQQHTGQHIISAALWTVGKYKTLSVHMGIDYTTIEIAAPGIPDQELIEVETLANRVINRDMPLSFIKTNHKELDKYPLRKPTSREGEIRLVKIGNFDCAACGGLHFAGTRSVELVKATGIEKIRGNARITWKIGQRAFEDYRKKDKIIAALKPVLSTSEDMFVRKTEELKEEILSARRKYSRIENRLAGTIAQNLSEDPRNRLGACRVISQTWQEEDDSLIKKIVKNLLKGEKTLVCFVNILPGRLQWTIGSTEDIVFPFEGIKDELLRIIDGKGGGRPPLWQGTGLKAERAGDFVVKFRTFAHSLEL